MQRQEANDLMRGTPSFQKAAEKLWQINAAFIGIFVFGPGLTMPAQTSADPATACMAPLAMYQLVALLQAFLVPVLVGSLVLSGAVSYTAGETLRGKSTAMKMGLRASLLVAIVMSVVCVGVGLTEYGYVLQAKFVLFDCMSSELTGALWACYAVVGAICACGYIRFGWTAVLDD